MSKICKIILSADVFTTKQNLAETFHRANSIQIPKRAKRIQHFLKILGVAESVAGIRKMFEQRCGVQGKALRIEKAKYLPREGKSSLGCPIAKSIVRRTNLEEKYLIICKNRVGHRCANQWIVISIIAWDGVDAPTADFYYDKLSETLSKSSGNI